MGSALLLIVVLFLLSALFSAAETALTFLSHFKISRMLEQKLPGARLVHNLKEHPSEFLSAILIGNNFSNVAVSAIVTSLFLNGFTALGWKNNELAVGLATVLVTFILLLFGEITPKTVAIRNAEKTSLILAPLVVALQIILKPVVVLMGIISRPLIHLFGGHAPEKGPFVTEDEIHLILAAGEKEGIIEQEEREMITSIFEFGETIAREVMTPRPDIIAVEAAHPMQDILTAIIQSGHSRIPVYEGSLDNVIGVVYAKDLLKGSREDIRNYLRQALFVPETKKIADLLHEMQAARLHLAMIVDEYGITSGMVTMEDVVEEIVGEIHDEFEREEKALEKIDENTYLVDGKMSVADLNDQAGLSVPEGESDTIGGFVFGRLGKAPSVGDVVRYENAIINVERIHRRRITRVKIVKLSEEGQP